MKTTSQSVDSRPETQTIRVLAIGLLIVVLLVLLSGCKSEKGPVNPAGDYTLLSVDGKAVPCALSHEGMTPTIKSGLFSISTNGTCLSRITFSLPQQKDMVREVKATYTINGADLTMQWEGAGMTMGHVDGKQFTMTNEGMVFSYRK